MMLARRVALVSLTASALAMGSRWAGAMLALPRTVFRPEDFGAIGDGLTNDSAAFSKLAKAVNLHGGGTVIFRRTTYLVGRQQPTLPPASYAFDPMPLLEFEKCTAPLMVRGNGARICCAPGLRFGTFNRDSGTPTHHPMPFLGAGELASPYRYTIAISHCTAEVGVYDLELDGNADSLIVGGGYGDTGYQIPAIGLGLVENSGGEKIRNAYSHHHALDGILINGIDGAAPKARPGLVDNVRCEDNCRQGMSITSGRDYTVLRSRFLRTGKGKISSNPKAGVDIEAEGGKAICSLRFADRLFSDNAGAGMVADTGPSQDVTFERCTFIGTTNWSAWPNKPLFKFEQCTFIGALTRAYGDIDPARAAHFTQCNFLDDPTQAPNGLVYGGTNSDRPVADLSDAWNVLFDKCRFSLTHESVLPWSKHAIYRDCMMNQRSPPSRPTAAPS